MSQEYFERIADQWDRLRATMFGDEVCAALLERAGLHPQAVVVDLGAGTGFLSQAIAPLVRALHLVDNSPAMLSAARKKLRDFANLHYHQADGMKVPLPDALADAVVANMYLHHAPDPAQAIREMARLLKPAGRLVITDLDEHSYAWLQMEQHDLWLGFKREQVSAWLEAAGLVNVLVEDTRQSCRRVSQTGGEKAAVSIFIASATKADSEMTQVVASRYRQIAAGGGSCCAPAGSSAGAALPVGENAVLLEVLQPSASCCSPGDGVDGFSLNQGEADFSLGCGNPLLLAGLRPGQVVLDIGSGAGADVFPAARQVGEAGRVIGVDPLPEMIARAEATAERYGYRNVEFRRGEASALPADEDSVDVVISNCVINLVADKGRAFREAFRVLKPAGVLSISDIVTDRPFSPRLRRDPQSWAACVAGALPEDEYLALSRAAGFTAFELTRSQAWEAEDGTRVYSLLVKALKPLENPAP